MNKELIEKLKSVGFTYSDKTSERWLRLDVKNGFVRFAPESNKLSFFKNNNVFSHTNKRIYSFPLIIAAIKEHTGVDLQKKTKRQEIEGLKTLVKLQNEAIEKIERRSNELAQEVKANKKAIKENMNFTYGVDFGTDESKAVFVEVWQKPANSQEQPKTKFKVGDRVVLKNMKPYYRERLKRYEKDGVIFTIDKAERCDLYFVLKHENIDDMSLFEFPPAELQHAPKKLKFGGWAEVVGNASGHYFDVGQKVLVGCFDEDTKQYVCSSESNYWHCNPKDLKAL